MTEKIKVFTPEETSVALATLLVNQALILSTLACDNQIPNSISTQLIKRSNETADFLNKIYKKEIF